MTFSPQFHPQPVQPSQPLPTAVAARTLRDIDVGCRAGFLVITALLAWLAIYLSWQFASNNVDNVYAAMLKGSAKPALLEFILSAPALWFKLSYLSPILAIVCAVFIRRALWAFLAISACNLLLAAISALLTTSLLDGIGKVISSLA